MFFPLSRSRATILVAAILTLLSHQHAQAQAGAPGWPRRLPAPGGEVVVPSQGALDAYDRFQYASARRVEDTLYISGVVAGGGRPGQPADEAAFAESLRQAFAHIRRNLDAAGADFGDVVMINSFHVWDSPHFIGGKDRHFETVQRVKAEFMTPPHAAWTAVGTNELLEGTGLVEIQVIAHVPRYQEATAIARHPRNPS